MKIQFTKYQGTGNDFILIDDREGTYSNLNGSQIKKMCNRHFGIGADGLMLLNTHAELDFEMKYFNADGNISTMCGNGGRCIAAFAGKLGLVSSACSFMAADGVHDAILSTNRVELKMKDVTRIQSFETYDEVDTGSPHYVHFTEMLSDWDMKKEGALIRYSPKYREEGINVNFVEPVNEHSIRVRTYERGVEDETLSCGTGVTAAALCFIKDKTGPAEIHVATPGGELLVRCAHIEKHHFTDIWLCGPATMVFEGSTFID